MDTPGHSISRAFDYLSKVKPPTLSMRFEIINGREVCIREGAAAEALYSAIYILGAKNMCSKVKSILSLLETDGYILTKKKVGNTVTMTLHNQDYKSENDFLDLTQISGNIYDYAPKPLSVKYHRVHQIKGRRRVTDIPRLPAGPKVLQFPSP